MTRCTIRTRTRPRGAMLTLSVLVSLAVVIGLFTAGVRMLVLERQQVAAEAQRVQAEFLALSAADRAQARLAAEADYQGESWRVEPSATGLSAPGLVEIRVQPVDGESRSKRILVDARYPEGATQVARYHLETIYQLDDGSHSP